MSTQELSPACQSQLLLLRLSQEALGLLHLVDLGTCTVQHTLYSEREEIGSFELFHTASHVPFAAKMWECHPFSLCLFRLFSQYGSLCALSRLIIIRSS